MKDLRLIATDLDGTLIHRKTPHRLYRALHDTIRELKQDEPTAKWAICSGRRMSSFRRRWAEMLHMGLRPDFLVMGSAYIYAYTMWDFYVPLVQYNFRLWRIVRTHRRFIERALREWDAAIRTRYPEAQTSRLQDDYYRVAFPDSDVREQIVAFLKEKTLPFRDLVLKDYPNEAEILTVPFTKGLALSQLTRYLKIDPDQVLVIGDGYNDICMMEPATAEMTGCPANADPAVVQRVHDTKGHIAREPGLAGVLQIIDAYRNDTVSSELPEEWNAEKASHRRHSGAHRRSRRRHWRRLRDWALFLLAAAASIVALAHVGILPRYLARPLDWLVRLIAGL